MKAPFPYFGGKAKVASIVWEALGDCKHYIEPFFGSGAILLNRPNIHVNKTETVNDKDGFIANVWRAMKYNPDETAYWTDWPVNHADLIARKKVLINNKGRLLENLINDDEWYDPKIAGYWIWAASCWIAAGLTRINARPNIGMGGSGVHAMRHRPEKNHEINNNNYGKNPNIYKWFAELSERLRYVRVVCGDWTRVCGGYWQHSMNNCGMFFDPPYSDKANREKNIYDEDSETVAHDVRKWCIERGKSDKYRIVLAGYYEEHEELLQHDWTVYKWKSIGGYANISNKNTKGKQNRHKEALFFSPFCLINHSEYSLFND